MADADPLVLGTEREGTSAWHLFPVPLLGEWGDGKNRYRESISRSHVAMTISQARFSCRPLCGNSPVRGGQHPRNMKQQRIVPVPILRGRAAPHLTRRRGGPHHGSTQRDAKLWNRWVEESQIAGCSASSGEAGPQKKCSAAPSICTMRP